MTPSNNLIGFFTTDAQLNVRSWDDWLVRVTGILAGDARGQPLTSLIPDLEERGLLTRFGRVLRDGTVEVLAPVFHHYLIPCPPQTPSEHFDHMQQRVTIAPLREEERIVGALVTIEDVTARREYERDLASPDEDTRLRAAQALAAEEGEEPAKALMGVLGDESWRVRRVAVSGLAQRGGAGAVAALLRALREERRSLSVLNSALQVLAMSDLDVLTPLIEFLHAPEADMRTYAALALGEQRDPRAVPALLESLDDPDANVRYHVIEALGKLRASEAVEPLLAIAESRDFFLAFPALDALTQIGDPRTAARIVPLLADELLRTPAADALGQLGDEEAIAPLCALLSRPDAPTGVIAQALASLHDRYQESYGEGAHVADLTRRALTAAGAKNLLDALPDAHDDELRALALALGWLESEAVVRALTRLLGRPSVRKEIVEALVRHGERVTDLLIEQLEAEDVETRQAAVAALGRIGDARAVPSLVQVLTEDAELLVTAAGALAKIGDRRAFDALLDMLDHPAAAVRQAAISALNSLGHPEMPARAAALLNDPDPRVRESAVRIAGYFGFRECVDLLFERCHDEDETVQRAAIENIPYLEDERVLPTLIAALQDEAPKVRAAAVRALGEVDDPRVLTHLLHALGDADMWVRYYAARSLGEYALPETLDALARVVQTGEVSMVRAAAMEALGRIGGARAVTIIAPLVEAEEHDLSRAALRALGDIGHPDALPPLLAALRSDDAERRLDALHALGRRGGVGAAGALQWVAATDAEPRVAQAAIEALARLATPEAIGALIALAADPAQREACVAALAGLGADQVEQVAQGLTHAHVGVRRATVAALARMKHPRASEALIAALEDEDGRVRLEAVTALRRLGSRFAERTLARLAHDDPNADVRRAAQAALSNGEL